MEECFIHKDVWAFIYRHANIELLCSLRLTCKELYKNVSLYSMWIKWKKLTAIQAIGVFQPSDGSVEFFQRILNNVVFRGQSSDYTFFQFKDKFQCVILQSQYAYAVSMLHCASKQEDYLNALYYMLVQFSTLPHQLWRTFLEETWLFKKTIQKLLQKVLFFALFHDRTKLVKWTIQQGVCIKASMFEFQCVWDCDDQKSYDLRKYVLRRMHPCEFSKVYANLKKYSQWRFACARSLILNEHERRMKF